MFEDAKVYVGTYKKYNEGSIYGKWLTLSDYDNKDEFIEECEKIHSDEEDPEFMFQDWEGITKPLISESFISEKFWEYAELFEGMEEKVKAFETWAYYYSVRIDEEDPYQAVEEFNESYIGEYEKKEDFAEELITETIHDEFILRFFDFKKYADEIFLQQYFFANGYVFYNL